MTDVLLRRGHRRTEGLALWGQGPSRALHACRGPHQGGHTVSRRAAPFSPPPSERRPLALHLLGRREPHISCSLTLVVGPEVSDWTKREAWGLALVCHDLVC